jgi:hypothetical protein
MPKRRIFISFDHADTQAVNGFIGCRECVDSFDFYNHKLDHRINSSEPNYIARVIREEYIRPASVTVVLIGAYTYASEWVKWEISESIQQEKGILGIRLKHTWGPVPFGVPDDAVGTWQPDKFASWVEWAYQRSQAAQGVRRRNPWQ